MAVGLSVAAELSREWAEWVQQVWYGVTGLIFAVLTAILGWYARQLARVLREEREARLFPVGHRHKKEVLYITVVCAVLLLSRCVYDVIAIFDPRLGIRVLGGRTRPGDISLITFVALVCWEILPTSLVMLFFRHIPRTRLGLFSSDTRNVLVHRGRRESSVSALDYQGSSARQPLLVQEDDDVEQEDAGGEGAGMGRKNSNARPISRAANLKSQQQHLFSDPSRYGSSASPVGSFKRVVGAVVPSSLSGTSLLGGSSGTGGGSGAGRIAPPPALFGSFADPATSLTDSPSFKGAGGGSIAALNMSGLSQVGGNTELTDAQRYLV